MQLDDLYAALILAVFGAVSIGWWLYSRRLDPKTLKRWYPRFALLALAFVTPFFLAPALKWGDQAFLPLAIGIAVLAFGCVLILKTRICEVCGTVTHPQTLITAADFCPKCGAKLSATRLFE